MYLKRTESLLDGAQDPDERDVHARRRELERRGKISLGCYMSVEFVRVSNLGQRLRRRR